MGGIGLGIEGLGPGIDGLAVGFLLLRACPSPTGHRTPFSLFEEYDIALSLASAAKHPEYLARALIYAP